MARISWIIAALCVLLLVQIIRAVRREHIRVEYSMAWFGAAVVLLVLSLWDTALEWLAVTMGIDDVSLVLLLLAGLAFLFTFFRLTIEVSTLKDHNILVSQKVGMLEWEIRRQEEELRSLRDKAADE